MSEHTDFEKMEDAPLQLEEAELPFLASIGAELPAPPRRTVPNFGDAVLFVLIAAFFIFLCEATGFAMMSRFHQLQQESALELAREPKLIVPTMTAAYLLTLLSAIFMFPPLWRRSFADGIQWSWELAARLNWKLVASGLALGFLVQLLQNYLPMPKSVPMDDYFRTRADVWLVTFFGTLVAPAFEEIAFRGMLLPAFGNAWDWFARLGRNAGRETAERLPSLSPSRAALIFSSVLTSVLFALMHAQQLGRSVSPLALLFAVSLALTFVRLRTASVAASALVHASYNLSVFLAMFVGTGGYQHLERLKN